MDLLMKIIIIIIIITSCMATLKYKFERTTFFNDGFEFKSMVPNNVCQRCQIMYVTIGVMFGLSNARQWCQIMYVTTGVMFGLSNFVSNKRLIYSQYVKTMQPIFFRWYQQWE